MSANRQNARTRAVVLGMIASFMVAIAAACDTADTRDDEASGRPIPPGAITTLTPLTDEQRAERFQPGPAWDGKGARPWTMEDVEAFDDYAVYWVGPSLGPYNLQTVSHTAYEAPTQIPEEYRHDQDMVMFIYGKCTIAVGAESCSVPATIQVQPICLLPPAHAAPSDDGALIQHPPGQPAEIWTGDVTIRIDAPADQSLVDEAIAALRIANGQGRSDRLSAPDLSVCDAGMG